MDQAFLKDLSDLYQRMSEAFSAGQKTSGLACPSGCGQCCLTPTVEASVLEMLPMAIEFDRQGKAEEMLEKLQQETPSTCVVYQGDQLRGQCSMYEQRPSVCRMFAVAGAKKKDGSPTLSLCKILKAQYPERSQELLSAPPQDIPQLGVWEMHLMTLHPELTRERHSISFALRKALEKVLLVRYYSNSSN